MKASSDRLAGCVVLLFAVGILYEAFGLEFTTDIGPGPGFLPIGVSVLLAALSLALIFGRQEALPEAEQDGAWSRHVAGRVAAIFAGIFGFFVLMQPLGFLLSGFLFLLFLLVIVESRAILSSFCWAAGAAGGFYLIFAIGLNVRLPTGPFGF